MRKYLDYRESLFLSISVRQDSQYHLIWALTKMIGTDLSFNLMVNNGRLTGFDFPL